MTTISASNLLNTISNNGNKYTMAYTKYVREADEDVNDFQEKFTEFRKIVRRLNNYSSNDTTEDKLKDYLSDFADTYNSMVKNNDKLTDSSLTKQLDKLDTLIDDNIKNLKKLGLKRNDDGELEFDEDTFDDDYDQKIVDKLFTGTDSFIDQARKLMRNIDRSATDADVQTVQRHLSSTTVYDKSDYDKAANYATVQTLVKMLNDNTDNTNHTKEEILNSIVNGVNKLEDDDIIKLFQNDTYKDNLSKLGIAYDENTKKLKYTATTSNNTDGMDSNSGTTTTNASNYVDPGVSQALNALFNNAEDSFSSQLIKLCKDGFNNTLKTSTIGVSIDSYEYCKAIDETV